MNQLSFNIRIGDNVIFLGKTNHNFDNNNKYKILNISNFGEYPFNNAEYNEIAKQLENPKIITIRDKNKHTFFLLYTNEGFINDDLNDIDFSKFNIERKLRKDKLDKINNK